MPFLPRGLAQKWREPSALEPIEVAMAAAVAVPSAILRERPLPEHYFMYFEEQEWCWHLRAAGIPVHLEPAAVALHDGGRADVRAEKDALLARNAVRCVRRTQGRAAAARAWPVVVLWRTRLLVVEALRSSRRSSADRAFLQARRAGLVAALRAFREIP